MKKLIFPLLVLIFAQTALASEDDRLMGLLKKKSELNMVGKELSTSDLSELEKLISQRGLIKVAEIQNQMKLSQT